MRQLVIRAIALTTLIGGTSLAYAFSTGPQATRTGARGFPGRNPEPVCTLCHGSGVVPAIPLNDPSGSLRVLDVPTNYIPGQTYTLRVQLQHTWQTMPPDPLRWGFQMQAIQASTGDSSGTWILPPNTPPDTFRVVKGSATSVYKNRRYVEHTRNINSPIDPSGSTRLGELGPVEWPVKWQAPPGDSGKIYFFAAGNSANGDGLSIGSTDYIFTTVESTTAGASVDVPPHPTYFTLFDALDAPSPNPMQKCVDLSFTVARGGVVDLAIFDLQGRRVRTILHGFLDAGSHGATWSGKNDLGEWMRNSIYFVRLSTPDQRVISRKITLAR